MRKLIAVVLGAALLAGCAAAPAASESAAAASGTAQTTPAPTEEPTAAEDPVAYDTTGEQINVLDQLVDLVVKKKMKLFIIHFQITLHLALFIRLKP